MAAMKKFVLPALIGSLLFCIYATAETFVEPAEWESEGKLNYMAIQGIRMYAIQNAIEACELEGHTLCAYKSSQVVRNNIYNRQDGVRVTQAVATIQSLDGLKVVQNNRYRGKAKAYFEEYPTEPETQGILEKALEYAVQKCQGDGNHFCVMIKVDIITDAKFTYSQNLNKEIFETVTRAIVKGFKIR
jgi:acid stress-induced BolA-like protein IbaG/YrbA